MATRSEILDKMGVVNHMVGIARHNRREQEAATDPNVGRVLALLRMKDGVTTQEMSTILGIDGAVLGATLDAMTEGGLVEVDAPESGPKTVTLTDEGREDKPSQAELCDVALDGFSDDEADALMAFLERMEGSLEGEIGADWKEREEERKAAKKHDSRQGDRGGREGNGFRGGDRGGRGGFRGGDRGGYRGGREDRGDRGGYRGGNRGGFRGGSRDDRGGYRGGSRDGFRGNRDGNGFRGGDRGGRGGYRGGRDDRNDRGGYRGGDRRRED
ncbi:MAG: MarR family winged helix-turn-helix transcriptional regulator [Parafannyhessea sp.]|uniref:MarR family winged helix-turn-helix transcriptional regulator n=1 Tax=Parafannyhessea sp. TaxID=2847324 RepID=UPI003F065BFA